MCASNAFKRGEVETLKLLTKDSRSAIQKRIVSIVGNMTSSSQMCI